MVKLVQTPRQLLFAAALALLPMLAAAVEPESNVLATLRQGGELSCQPLTPYFCENVHVRCAGQTTIQTFAFKLTANTGGKSVLLAAQEKEDQRPYEGAVSEWSEDGSSLLLTPRSAGGYVKVLSAGKYVFRYYVQGRGVMSLGQCK